MRLSPEQIELARISGLNNILPTQDWLDTIDALESESSARVAAAFRLAAERCNSLHSNVIGAGPASGDSWFTGYVASRRDARKLIESLIAPDADLALRLTVAEAVRKESEWFQGDYHEGRTFAETQGRIALNDAEVEKLKAEIAEGK